MPIDSHRRIHQTDLQFRRAFTLCLGAILCISSGIISLETIAAEEKEKGAEKTRKVSVGAITLDVPAPWKQEKPSNRMRLSQFAIPAAKGDKEGGELAISSFKGGGGALQANLQRWVGQFDTKGRKVKLTQGKAPHGNYALAEITGTYNESIGPPIAGKKKKKPGSRMLAVRLETKGGVYYLKLTGPDKTVAESATAFRASYGAKKEGEKEFKLKG